MSLDQIEELAVIISPKFAGKPYAELEFFQTMKQAEQSWRFKVCAEAQRIRMEAIKRAKKSGRSYERMKWPELLQWCEAVLEEQDYMKKAAREPGEEG
jgi:hypothetical protein